jgi:hypothetical protein
LWQAPESHAETGAMLLPRVDRGTELPANYLSREGRGADKRGIDEAKLVERSVYEEASSG